MRVEPVLEVELAGVAQLHDGHGRERLRDRADSVLVLGRGLLAVLRVGEADGVGPYDLAAADDGRRDGRESAFRLRLRDDCPQLAG